VQCRLREPSPQEMRRLFIEIAVIVAVFVAAALVMLIRDKT
jgi:hypothetical protein